MTHRKSSLIEVPKSYSSQHGNHLCIIYLLPILLSSLSSLPFPPLPIGDLVCFTALPPLPFWIRSFFCWDGVALSWHKIIPFTFRPVIQSVQTKGRPHALQVCCWFPCRRRKEWTAPLLWVSLCHFNLKLGCGISHGNLRANHRTEPNSGDQMDNIPPILLLPSPVPHVQSPALLFSPSYLA